MLSSCKAESRLIDGSDNNLNNPTSGTPKQNFQMKYPPEPFFGPDGDSMIKSPSDIVNTDPTKSIPKCTDPLPADTYPMPRCISNIITNYRLDQFDIGKAMSYRSKRQTSHLTTFFAQFVSFDISGSRSHVQPSLNMYIPTDDATYNAYDSATKLPGQLSNLKALPFNRSDFLPTTTQKPKRTGYNSVTPFLDLNAIYGISAEDAKALREGIRGKLKTSGNAYDPYPFKDLTTGNYFTGPTSKRSNNVFTMAIQTIWLREHNRLCDVFYKKNGDAWTDDQYFEEARKWNIAFYQKVVTEEYLGVVMGKPLPPYQKYDPDLIPGIDVFFSTITFKYGHSELSDFYQIHDEYDSTIIDLSLENIMRMDLLEKFGTARLLRSMTLQRQEDVDIYYSDASRNIKSLEPVTYDLPAFDALRARDRGIALYNDVRQAYGLEKKDSWADVTSVKELQDYLQQLYPNGTNQLEAFVGAMVEDHLDGSNFGELMSISMVTQFMNIRDSDRFWWENKDNLLFTDEDRAELRNTTFRSIIMRNLADIFQPEIPQSIWSVQPPHKLPDSSSKYLNRIALWPTAYIVGYEIVGKYINFQVQILTTNGNAWFGMGFDPDDNGMSGADFVIGIISNGNVTLSNYRSAPSGYNPPIPDGDDSDLLIINNPPIKDNFAIIEFSRPLAPNGRKEIKNGIMKYVLAYNPTSSVFSYHQNNRQLIQINFHNYIILSPANGQRFVKLAHGIGMFMSWCVLFPVSIYIVRYYKHTNNYIKIHRFMQFLGTLAIGSFGAAAMATISTKSIHSWLGVIIYLLLFIELGFGIISIWGQASIVSVNQGYPRFVKRIHRFFGFSLIIFAWVNIYFGIETYCLSYGLKSLYYRIAYLIWICVVIATFVFGEYWWNLRGTWRWRNILSKVEKGNDSILSLHITKEDFVKLPELTWSEVNERVQRGAYLVVCDGFIVNMRKWIKVHPGGAKILERVIGTDITNDFFGYKGDEIIEHIDIPETKTVQPSISASVLGQYTAILFERTKKYTTKRNSFAQVVDDINTKYFLKAPLAIHPHSLFAIKKIATMIVAKLKDSTDVETPFAPIFGPTNVADGGLTESEIAQQDTAFRIKFRRYKLTTKVPVNGSKEFPVMKFTFTIVHQNNEAYRNHHHRLKFLPGHYIEVQSRIKGQVVIRSYTPIEGNIVQSFSIFVKVYPDGLMSRHLNGQLKGYEIQVRGPFDVGDRLNLQMPSLSQAADVTSQYRKSSVYTNNSSSFISSSTSSLLNPNTQDGHWKELYMICGGTGITPMLQLIIYHLELCTRRNRGSAVKVKMHLLYGNRKIEDIINGVELEEYKLWSGGKLTITYALDEHSNDWSGKSGEINQEMISDWLNSNSSRLKSPNTIQFNDYNTTNSPMVNRSSSRFGKHLSYVDSNKSERSSTTQFNDPNDNNINTNATNSSISITTPQFHDPYGDSSSNDDNDDNLPPLIPLNTKPRKPLSSINNPYRTSINPESTLSHNYSRHYRTSLPSQQHRSSYLTISPPSLRPSPLNTFNNNNNLTNYNHIDGLADLSRNPSSLSFDDDLNNYNKKKPKLNSDSKIIVCGQLDMINIVEESLKNLDYTEEDFILIA